MRTNNYRVPYLLLTSCGMLCNLLPAQAQQTPEPAGAAIDGAVRSQVIESVLTKLNAQYVFPEVAKKMETAIHARMQNVGKDVYVLTSKNTFSGAEEFTYNLKTQKRATIIGETTGGGANPGSVERVNAHFGVFVPAGRAINPITKTNREGVGVKPDIDIPASQALLTAHQMALQKQLAKETDPDRKDALKEILKTTRKELDESAKKQPQTSTPPQ